MRFQVVIDDILVGEVLAETQNAGRVAGSFTYDPGWIRDPNGWAIDPAWPLQLGAWPFGPTLPGALADSAPDDWGRRLIRLRGQGAPAGRSWSPLDYLLGTSDVTRQGALRFRLSDRGEFQHPSASVPPLVDLPRLMDAARRAADGEDDAVGLLLAGGTGSLGGARPKAAVSSDGGLMIAKFPSDKDDWDVMGMERTALELAASVGIRVPDNRLVEVGKQSALLLDRFDRRGSRRIGYVSALTMLELPESAAGDYLDIVEVIGQHSISAKADLAELWRRIAFSIGFNNTDDHCLNHGFLREGVGWRLAPAFDINPSDTVGHRATSVAGATIPALAIGRLLDHAGDFGVNKASAHQSLAALKASLINWPIVAARNGVPGCDIDRLRAPLAGTIAVLDF